MKIAKIDYRASHRWRRFLSFNFDQPVVWVEYQGACFSWLDDHRDHSSSEFVCWILRLYKGYQINQDHKPYFSRMFVLKYPQYEKFFTLREFEDGDPVMPPRWMARRMMLLDNFCSQAWRRQNEDEGDFT